MIDLEKFSKTHHPVRKSTETGAQLVQCLRTSLPHRHCADLQVYLGSFSYFDIDSL